MGVLGRNGGTYTMNNNIIEDFIETIICESKDSPTEFVQILDENFMEILVLEKPNELD